MGVAPRPLPGESLYAALSRFPMFLFQLMFRIAVGGVFWASGQTKIASWQTTLVLFRDEYRVPLLSTQLAATLATSIELACPILLVLGLAARIATLPMLAMIFVIEAFVYPEDWLQHLSWAAMLLFILTRGPGLLSIDHFIARAWKRSGPQGAARRVADT
jgi:putative oxidoreductase